MICRSLFRLVNEMRAEDLPLLNAAGSRRPFKPLWNNLVFLALLLAAGGCGKKGRRPVVPVRGEVVCKTKKGTVPTKGAQVEFYLQNDQGEPLPIRPVAKVRDDGTFEVCTYELNDGLPEGEYKVTVAWDKTVKFMGEDRPRGSLVKDIYRDPNKTPLRATVKFGMESLRFEVE